MLSPALLVPGVLAPILLALSATPLEVTRLDPPVDLAGSWTCRVSEARTPPDDTGDASTWNALVIPEPRGKAVCDAPSVWLRSDVVVPAPLRAAPLGVSLGEVRGSYTVFIDGESVGAADDLRRGIGFAVPSSALEDGVVRIDVHVTRDAGALSTTQDHRVVVEGPVAIGGMPNVHDRARATVAARVQSESSATLAMSALFLFVGLYHVLVWLLRRDLLGYLWFGIFALTAMAWTAIEALARTELVPFDARTAAIAGNFFGSLVNAAFIEFSWRYLTKKRPSRGWRIYAYVLVAIAFIGFIPTYGVALTVNPVVIAVKVLMPIASVVAFARLARRGNRETRALFVGLALAAIGAPFQVYVQSKGIHLAVQPGQAALALFCLAMAVALIAQFARTLDEVEAINHSIERFVPFPFLDILAKKSVLEVSRGDATATTMSVMFCDLRGFTTLAEHMGHAETFRFINTYLEKMEPHILKTGGFINQYLGDGIMALFPKGPDAAVATAIAMSAALDEMNVDRARAGQAALKIGVGIHTGKLMLGTIGGSKQLDSGVIGDVVNTAARLEGITKMYGARVLISGETMAGLTSPERYALRPLDSVKAKGKKDSLQLVEVLDAEPRATRDEKVASRGALEAALAVYRKGSFEDAALQFAALADKHPNDGAAAAFRERCRELMHDPPSAWTGVHVLTTK